MKGTNELLAQSLWPKTETFNFYILHKKYPNLIIIFNLTWFVFLMHYLVILRCKHEFSMNYENRFCNIAYSFNPLLMFCIN